LARYNPFMTRLAKNLYDINIEKYWKKNW
jgi:hypothetical protein